MKQLVVRIRSITAFTVMLLAIAGFIGMVFLRDYAGATITAQVAIQQMNNGVESSALPRAFIDNYQALTSLGMAVFAVLGGFSLYYAFFANAKDTTEG